MNLVENKEILTREDYPVSNVLVDGVLSRTVRLPKGHLVVGEIHKYESINFLISGELRIHYNGKVNHLKAPSMIVSKANTRKVVFALEDVVWTSIHKTDKTNIKDIEEDLIIKEDIEQVKEYLTTINKEELLCLG